MKIKKIIITEECLLGLFVEPAFFEDIARYKMKVFKGIPGGSRIVEVNHLPQTKQVEIIIKNDRFPDIKEGEAIPVVAIYYGKDKRLLYRISDFISMQCRIIKDIIHSKLGQSAEAREDEHNKGRFDEWEKRNGRKGK